MGFIQTKFKGELNQQQKKYLLNHFHHIGFYNPEEKVQLELHWQLNTNKYLLEYNFAELYKKALVVEVGNQNIKTPEPLNLVIHLMVHGAHHAWARLDWLYEYAFVLSRYENQFENIKSECKKLGLENLFNYSTRLMQYNFSNQLSSSYIYTPGRVLLKVLHKCNSGRKNSRSFQTCATTEIQVLLNEA